jgi:hypothetical protein
MPFLALSKSGKLLVDTVSNSKQRGKETGYPREKTNGLIAGLIKILE